MILQFSNPLLIPKILELAKTVPDTPIDTLEKMLLAGINDTDTVIYIDEKDSDVNGFIFASKETWQGKLVAFIQFCSVKQSDEDKYTAFELLTKVKLWAKDKGLSDMVFVTKRDYKLFERKYKFKLDGYILKKEVSNG